MTVEAELTQILAEREALQRMATRIEANYWKEHDLFVALNPKPTPDSKVILGTKVDMSDYYNDEEGNLRRDGNLTICFEWVTPPLYRLHEDGVYRIITEDYEND